MALSDLLWACPVCGVPGSIDDAGRCPCGATFARARGARIQAKMPDGTVVDRTAAEWSDLLPDPATLLETPGGRGTSTTPSGTESAPDGGVVRRAQVVARQATGTTVVRGKRGAYLNRVEVYGPRVKGTLELGRERLVFRQEGQEPLEWSLDDLSALQASSSTLQLKDRRRPLVSFRFLDDSIYLWESLIQAAVRAHYRRTGRGEIVEFQPRIVTR